MSGTPFVGSTYPHWFSRIRRVLVPSALTLALVSWPALGATPLDPYADTVGPATEVEVELPENALRAPNRAYATLPGVPGVDLWLDMGDGEEGTGSLAIHYLRSPSGANGYV